MKLNIVDQYDVFAINDDIPVSELILENGLRVLKLENFYKYPEKVKEFAGTIPLPKYNQNTNSVKNGYMTEALFIIPKDTVYKKIHDVIREYYGPEDEVYTNTEFTYDRCAARFNLYDNSTTEDHKDYPHVDPYDFGALIYLNEDNYGGTAILRHKASGMSSVPVNESQSRVCKEHVDPVISKQILESFKKENSVGLDYNTYEDIHEFTGEFNSVLIFNPSMLHCSKIDFKKIILDNETRVVQVMFINKKSNNSNIVDRSQ